MILDRKQLVLLILVTLGVFLIGLLVCSALVTPAKADRVGDVIEFLGQFRDVNGVAAVPDTGKFIVFVNGVPYDSTAELTDLSAYRSYRTLQYAWLIPSLDDSTHISCVFRGSDTGGIVKDEFLMSPARVVLDNVMVASEVWQPVKVDSFATNAYTELNANLDLDDVEINSVHADAISDLNTGLDLSGVSIDDVAAGALSDLNSGLDLANAVTVDDVAAGALSDLNSGLDLANPVSVDEMQAAAITDLNDTSTGLDLVTIASEVWAPVKVDSTAANFITELNAGLDLDDVEINSVHADALTDLNAGLDLANAVSVDDVQAAAIADMNDTSTGLDLVTVASEVWAPVKVDSTAANFITELNAGLDLANAVVASEVWAPVKVDSTAANFITELNAGLDLANAVSVDDVSGALAYLNANLDLVYPVKVDSFAANAYTELNENLSLTAAVLDSVNANAIEDMNDGLTITAEIASIDSLTDNAVEDMSNSLFLDSLTVNAIGDMQLFTASANTAVIDSSDAGGIYYANGSVVTGARVYATQDSASWGTNWWYTTSTLGNYYLAVPKAAGDTLTYYISAYYPGTWAKTWEPVQVIGN